MNIRTALLGTLALGLIVGLAPVSSSLASGRDDSTRSSSSGSSGSGKSAAKDQRATELRLIGTLGSDDNGVKYRARYEERVKGSKASNRRFDVEVQGAQPGQTFAVVVAGKTIATITANTLGRAKIEFRPSPDDANEKPLPAGFPRLKVGDTVQIGAITVTLRQK